MLNKPKILITGASGFLGQYVVTQALNQGYRVRAISRSVHNSLWDISEQLEVVSVDLLNQDSIIQNLSGIDVVIHLAASKTSDPNQQFNQTVKSTDNLLAAMKIIGIKRLIAISSFSVFDYFNIPIGTTIDEHSPLESNPKQRDVYAQMKLKQEELFCEFQNQFGGQVTVLRPGMIYGKNNLWSARLGIKKGDNIWGFIDSSAQLPLIYVENCADGIILAIESEASVNQIINLVDDNLVEQSVYLNQILPYLQVKPKIIKIDWSLVNLMANLASQTNKIFFQGQKSLPGIFSPPSLQARFKPLKYINAFAKKTLNWQPQYNLETALERIVELSK